jgi:hypothetical protein
LRGTAESHEIRTIAPTKGVSIHDYIITAIGTFKFLQANLFVHVPAIFAGVFFFSRDIEFTALVLGENRLAAQEEQEQKIFGHNTLQSLIVPN